MDTATLYKMIAVFLALKIICISSLETIMDGIEVVALPRS